MTCVSSHLRQSSDNNPDKPVFTRIDGAALINSNMYACGVYTVAA